MLSEKIFLFAPSNVFNVDQYTVEVYFQNTSRVGFLNLNDYVKDTANNEYQILSGTIPHTDGGVLTVQAVTSNVKPVEDSGYNSFAYTPGQVDLTPAVRTSGSIGTSAIFSAPNYEWTILTGWTNPAQENKAVVGDRIVDLNGKEYRLTFIDGTSRFAVPCRVTEVERVGVAPALGGATLYRETTNFDFYQGSEITDPARTVIFNRDKFLIDTKLKLLESAGGGGGGPGNFIVEYRTISVGEATAKQMTLNNIPDDPTEVLVDVIFGSSQQRGVDYQIVGSVFDWATFTLDGVLSAGDRVRLVYFT